MVLFRQLFDHVSSTYTYLLADLRTREAVLIDPVFEQHTRDAALLRELELVLRYALDTHCHADHVTGAWLMKAKLGAQVALAKDYGAAHVDRALSDGDTITFGAHQLEVRATPGHTVGCLSFVSHEARMVFTGDALLVRGTGRTDFQGVSAQQLYHSIGQRLFSLPDDYLVYPAHDYEGRTVSTIGEERRYNPRIGGGAREEDFVGYMQNLGLPHPKQIDHALPANMRSGRPMDSERPEPQDWAPLQTTYAGLTELAPEWVASHRDDVQILDVRSEAEFDGQLGHLTGARLIPLDALRARAGELEPSKPWVVVCQTGRRAGMATLILKKAGFERVTSLAGGMVRWHQLGLPT